MQAVHYEQFSGPVRLRDVPEPVAPDHGVVIRVEASGLCRSDWHGWMGHDADISLPHVPGHEFAGVIEAVGADVRGWRIGDRVTVPFVCGCGQCRPCRDGQAQVCDHQFQPGFTHWGSFAERVAVHYAAHNLVRLPDALDAVTAASLGCRFATSFRAVVDVGKVARGQWVAVHGCGGVGLSAVMIAAAFGARVIAVDISEEALNLARQAGAEVTLRADHLDDPAEAIRDASGGGVDLSIEALGHPQLVAQSLASLARQGMHVQVGLLDPEQCRVPLPTDLLVARELRMAGSHGMQAWRYPQMLDMIASGRMDPRRLVTGTIALAEVPERLVRMNEFAQAGVVVIDRF